MRKKIKIAITFLLVISMVYLVSASYSSVNVQTYKPTLNTFYSSSDIGNYWPILSETESDKLCNNRQDFIVQIDPLGCSPAVVRSDLLANQNVPVFCKLSMIKLNPLIDVKAIDRINPSIQGEYPDEIAGVGFHPARAALNSYDKLLGSPLIDNIGYVVLILKRNEIEKNLSNYVSGNLTASITYNLANAWGVGRSEYYLPILTDEEWQRDYKMYEFWRGKGYLRLVWMDAEKAEIAIYKDAYSVMTTRIVYIGKTSDKAYLPGYYCLAGLQLRLDEISNPKLTARLQVNDDVIEVTESSRFWDDKCRVSNIKSYGGGAGLVSLYCNGETIDISIDFSEINLKVDEVEKKYAVGDLVKTVKENSIDKNIYVVYSGLLPESLGYSADNRRFIVLAKTPINLQTSQKEFLRTYLMGEIAQFAGSTLDAFKKRIALKDYEFFILTPVESDSLSGIKVASFSFTDKDYSTDKNPDYRIIEDYFADARRYYEEVAKNYPAEKVQSQQETLGEKALVDAANLAGSLGKIKSQRELLQEIIDSYPDSGNAKKAQGDLNKMGSFNTGRTEFISTKQALTVKLISLREVQSGDANVEIVYRTLGDVSAKTVSEGGYIDNTENKIIKVSKLYDDKITIEYRCQETSKENLKETKIELTSTLNDVESLVEGSKRVILKINNAEKEINKASVSGDIISLLDISNNEIVKGDKNKKLSELNVQEAKYITTTAGTSVANLAQTTAEIKVGGIFSQCDFSITVNKINLKKSAKIVLLPDTQGAETQVNFSYKIGIEKRAIQLAPEEAQEKIDNLNKSIKEFEDLEKGLGDVVKATKAVCYATSAFLTVKNLFSNFDGKAIARNKVMRDSGGWMDICTEALKTKKLKISDEPAKDVNYASMDDCLAQNNDNIESSVNKLTEVMNTQNTEIKALEEDLKKQTGIASSSVNTDESAKRFINKKIGDWKTQIQSVVFEKDAAGNTVNGAEVLGKLNQDSYKDGYINYEQLKTIDSSLKIINGGEEYPDYLKYQAKEQLRTALSSVDSNLKVSAGKVDLTSTLGLKDIDVDYVTVNKANKRYYKNVRWGQVKEPKITGVSTSGIRDDTPVAIIEASNGKKYLYILQLNAGKKYTPLQGTSSINTQEAAIAIGSALTPSAIPPIVSTSTNNQPQIYELTKSGTGYSASIATDLDQNLKNLYFEELDANSYKNPYKNYEVRYWETQPYKGMPALVPLDIEEGWYAATQQTIAAFGSLASFEESGRVVSFWLCNVGVDGRESFDTLGDDKCMMINLNTGQSLEQFPNLDSDKASQLIKKAQLVLQEAADKYTAGIKKVTLNNVPGTFNVGNPAAGKLGTACQDFMSPEDCLLMFNVCDPVICPSSRCNMAGNYYVNDVVQSGIFGSIALCLPNFREGIIVPVCLSGVYAGVQGYNSILKAHRDCLQENLKSGKTIGICDEIYSIYMCDFFWKQAAPFANLVVPSLLSSLYGQGARGGGEYATVQKAWDNMQASFNYFTNYYAKDAINAFKVRSTEEAGASVCKAFVSTSYADIDLLLEPDSPSQFYAEFSETTYTTATVPATSQYKVYYHIYAGEDAGVYYSVFLRDPPGTSFYENNPTVTVATGFTGKGSYADETKTFTAPSGYKELCVRINDQEECDFKQVSSDFLVTYVKDQYMASQAQESVSTTSQCISGSSSVYSMFGLNLQAGAEEVLNPELYNSGIIRVCSSTNPGKSTEPERWKDIGYCDDKKMRCYIDQQSVENEIKGKDLRNETITSIGEMDAANFAEILGKTVEEMNKEAGKALEEKDTTKVPDFKKEFPENSQKKVDINTLDLKIQTLMNFINKYLENALMNSQKAKFILNKGEIYNIAVRALLKDWNVDNPTNVDSTAGGSAAKKAANIISSYKELKAGDSVVLVKGDIAREIISINVNTGVISYKNSDGTTYTQVISDAFMKAFPQLELGNSVHSVSRNGVQIYLEKEATSNMGAGDAIRLEYLEGQNDYFVFRWNNRLNEIEVKMNINGGGFSDDEEVIRTSHGFWFNDKNMINDNPVGYQSDYMNQAFAKMGYNQILNFNKGRLYDYEIQDVVAIMNAGKISWAAAQQKIGEIFVLRKPNIYYYTFSAAEVSQNLDLSEHTGETLEFWYNSVQPNGITTSPTTISFYTKGTIAKYLKIGDTQTPYYLRYAKDSSTRLFFIYGSGGAQAGYIALNGVVSILDSVKTSDTKTGYLIFNTFMSYPNAPYLQAANGNEFKFVYAKSPEEYKKYDSTPSSSSATGKVADSVAFYRITTSQSFGLVINGVQTKFYLTEPDPFYISRNKKSCSVMLKTTGDTASYINTVFGICSSETDRIILDESKLNELSTKYASDTSLMKDISLLKLFANSYKVIDQATKVPYGFTLTPL